MSQDAQPTFQKAGSVDIQTLAIVSSSGKYESVIDFLSELNLFEDIFSNAMYGNMLVADSRNMLKEFPIVGDEYLVLKFKTPSTNFYITKTFRIYSVTDREIVRDLNTQVYTLHFTSKETFIDSVSSIYKSFSGRISDVVRNIYKDFLQTDRTLDYKKGELVFGNEKTNLFVLNETANSVKFVSPGWTPFKCINWCASKSIPETGKACNYLFFESNKNFYFGNIETIFNTNFNTGAVNLGTYYYKVNNTVQDRDPNRKMFLVEDFQITKTMDHLENYQNGYLANRLITLDVINKKYEFYDHDHVTKFKEYGHSQGNRSIPIFAPDAPRDAGTSVKFYPIHPGLHTVKDNVNEKMPVIYGNRLSNLQELSNFKLTLNVPGRTDAEVGAMLYFSYPDVSPKSEQDITSTNEDKYYSGFYIVTAIRHRLTTSAHTMTMEIVKDALNSL